MSADERVFIIVGASLAGAKAAEALRAEGFTGRVLLIGQEHEVPYERPPLSKGYLLGNDPREQAYVHEPAWYEQQRVELMTGRRVAALHPQAHTVTLDGGDQYRYDRLLLATGSAVRILDTPGADEEGVLYLRSFGDSDTLRAALTADPSPQVLVVGAGWIGLEVAAAARSHGCPVTVVETGKAPLHRVLGDELAALFRDLHAANGVEFHFGTGVREFGTLDGRVRSAVLDDGTELGVDLVAVGVGIRPRTELAEHGGLEVDDGVLVDASLRTSDPDVFACGDVANSFHPMLDRRLRVEHWSNAIDGGQAAAKAMLGQEVSYDPVPYFFTDQYDLGMEYCGWAGPGDYDRVVFRGDPAVVDGKAPEVIAFWLRGECVVAAMNINVWDVQDDLKALVRAGWAGRSVDPDRLTDPEVPLADLLG
ncbi:NAD(P)/FAD-dependent oxidoreductase [Catellatospora tritici]|uniref:NAD(P)/FAD-dependent oxidoreductase n=1 Tax=Catellatospora tritici TaxID=2851566 RepID=UPI001C2D3B42|nr:FAD-dependent oxidoreductase [Catellatospora tritici]MBV1851685.1 FAD-dependent oxidoreductase [Catellatospora tritici]